MQLRKPQEMSVGLYAVKYVIGDVAMTTLSQFLCCVIFVKTFVFILISKRLSLNLNNLFCKHFCVPTNKFFNEVLCQVMFCITYAQNHLKYLSPIIEKNPTQCIMVEMFASKLIIKLYVPKVMIVKHRKCQQDCHLYSFSKLQRCYCPELEAV